MKLSQTTEADLFVMEIFFVCFCLKEDVIMERTKDAQPNSASSQRPGSARERTDSGSRARTDAITTIEVCIDVNGRG